MTRAGNKRLSPAETRAILVPYMRALVQKYGVDKARQIIKRAAREAGLDPRDFDVREAPPS